jgi:hypothetical protein
MFAGEAKRGPESWVASDLASKHDTWLDRLPIEKAFSLFDPLVSHIEMKFVTLTIRPNVIRLFMFIIDECSWYAREPLFLTSLSSQDQCYQVRQERTQVQAPNLTCKH